MQKSVKGGLGIRAFRCFAGWLSPQLINAKVFRETILSKYLSRILIFILVTIEKESYRLFLNCTQAEQNTLKHRTIQ